MQNVDTNLELQWFEEETAVVLLDMLWTAVER